MRRKAKIKKLSTILVVYSMVILLVLNGITAVVMGMVASSAMSEKQDAYLQKTVDSAEEQVTEYLSGYIKVAELVANDPTIRKMTAYASNTVSMSLAPDFQENMAMLREIKERYVDILGFGIGNLEEDGIYAEDGKRYDVVLKERDYYAAVTENRTVVTQPYIDVTTKELCISIGVPIQQAGKTVGVLCLDLKLTEISNFLLNMAFGETGRAVLISEDDLIMGYSDPTRLGENFSTLGIKGEKFWKEYDAPTGKLVSYRLNGEERLAILKNIDGYNWTLLVGMSKAEYNAQTVTEVVILLLVLLCNLLIMSGFLWYLITKKLRPVGDINHALEQMSQGNLAVDVPYQSQDEIGEIAASIRSCAKTLDSYVKEIDRSMASLAEGDLTVTSSVQFKGDFAHIQYSIERFIRKLTVLVSNISLSAEQVRAGSDQVAASSQTLAQGSVEQSAAMEKLVEIIADISEQIRSNATDTDTANRQVTLADKSLQESSTHMEQMVDAMNRISSDSEKIRSIIKTMEDIAFQTNILALNAAVEAARAGQAGKGFAVVADEVRNLSGKSAEAAKKISQLIQNSMLSIQDGEDATKNTTQSLQKTVEQAMSVAQMIDKISVASNHQADAIKDINHSMDEISNVVQSNSVAAEESAAASEEFSAQAQVLKELIGQFKLAEELVDHDMPQIPRFETYDTASYEEESEPQEEEWHPAPETSSNPFSDKY